MAHFLRFNSPLNGQGDQASFATLIPMNVGDKFELDAVVPSSGNPTSAIFLIQNSSNYFAFNGANATRINIAGTLTTGATNSLSPYLDVLTTYIMERFTDRYEVRVGDNVLISASSTEQLSIARWGQGGTSSYVNMDFYEGRFYASGALTHQWIPSGSGSTVNDSVGTNHLTLENFPTDDSQYIEYIGLSVDQETAAPGDTLTWATELVSLTGAYLQDDSGNQYPLTSVTDTGGDLPALTGGLQACLFGFVDLVVTDGVDTVSSPIELIPPAGYELVTLESTPPTLVPTDWVFGFDDTADIGDQSLENNGIITHNADGSITWEEQPLTYTYYTVDATDGVVSEITKTFEEGAGVPDTTKPVITLLGNSTVTVTEGDSYTDAGATALDNVDGDITANIVTINPVDVNTPATYTIAYNVSDAAGNAADEVTRTVIVEALVVPSQPPIASAGPDQSVAAGATVQLDGTGSSIGGTYEWVQVSGPTVKLVNADSAKARIITPQVTQDEQVVMGLTVTVGGIASAQATVTINIASWKGGFVSSTATVARG